MIKNIFSISIILVCALICFSCDDEASDDCSGAHCPYVGNWKLKEVFLDDNAVDEDYSNYSLHLKEPSDGNVTGIFTRLFADQNDEGTWEVTNNDDVILLSTSSGVEEYLVESVSNSQLILLLYRESNKPGADMIRYVFDK
ncbi:MAG TPA: hypothetical protein VD884_12030 [Ohtaekwangia sp.]|nr:hypothetical protein [Ohtaekwangia sp.]